MVAIFVSSFNKSLVIEIDPVNNTSNLMQKVNASYIAYCQRSGVQSMLYQTYQCSDIHSSISISGVVYSNCSKHAIELILMTALYRCNRFGNLLVQRIQRRVAVRSELLLRRRFGRLSLSDCIVNACVALLQRRILYCSASRC